MTDTYSTRASDRSSQSGAATEFDKSAEFGHRAAETAKNAASDATSSARREIRGVLDQQIDNGAAYLGHAASSFRAVADDLSNNAPPLAGLADALAQKLDSVADNVKGKSAEDLWATASDFARRQPALVFGLASLAGFLAYRTIKSAQAPREDRSDIRTREYNGA
jgi:hypothetical protein